MLILSVQSLTNKFKKSKMNINKSKSKNSIRLHSHLACSHGLTIKERKGIDFYQDPKHDGLTTNFINTKLDFPWEPMKVFLDFYDLDQKLSQGKINDVQHKNIKEAINNAKNIFEQLLKVQRIYDRIYPNAGKRCTWDPKIVENGVRADIAICVSITDAPSVVASATFLQILRRNNRPVTGRIAFNPYFISGGEDEILAMTSTALHELTHVLVFDSDLYEYYVDSDFNKIPIEKILKTNSNNRKIIITPKVVEATKKHFNCESVEGLEVEDDGDEGTVASHWEERLMHSDYMCGMNSFDTSISEMTLALFEDSGWYKSEKFTGGLFNFGRNAGCYIFKEKCVEKKKNKFINEFCLKE